MPTVVSSDHLPQGLKWNACIRQEGVEITVSNGRGYARLTSQPDKVLVFEPNEHRQFIKHVTAGTFGLT